MGRSLETQTSPSESKKGCRVCIQSASPHETAFDELWPPFSAEPRPILLTTLFSFERSTILLYRERTTQPLSFVTTLCFHLNSQVDTYGLLRRHFLLSPLGTDISKKTQMLLPLKTKCFEMDKMCPDLLLFHPLLSLA